MTVLHRPRPIDMVLLVIAVTGVSTSAPVIREAAAPALALAMWRNLLGAAVVVPVALSTRRRRDALRAMSSRDRRLAVAAGALLGLHFALWIPSLSYTSVASSVALVATQPVWSALIAHLRGENVSRGAWTGILVAVAGAFVLSGFDLSLSRRALGGDALALLGAICAAAYVAVGAQARQTLSTTSYTAVCYSVAAAGLFVACLVGDVQLSGFSARTWWCIVALTVGAQLLGHSIFNRVLATTSATVVSVSILGEAIGGTVLAWIWFSEAPSRGFWPAAALIFTGVVLVVRAGRTAEGAGAGALAPRSLPPSPTPIRAPADDRPAKEEQ